MSLPAISHVLVIPRLRVQNANAISSPLTHGFPSMTAFLGLMWALERQLKQAGLDLPLNAVGVVCHDHQELVTDDGFVKSFRLTRNPIDKSGKTAAIVEEGRIHLEISLVFGVNIGTDEWREEYPAQVAEILNRMRIAGGTIHPQAKPWLRRYQPFAEPNSDSEVMKKISRQLLPGFTLVARDDLLDQRLQALKNTQPDATRLDAWLSLSRINWHYQPASDNTAEETAEEVMQETTEGKTKKTAEKTQGEWQHDRTGQGWIVPIPVGYGALGDVHPAGAVANSRDPQTPFRFVESLFSIGQWLAPHRLNSIEQLLWYVDSQPENGLYRCRNNFIKPHND
ncbi:type I-F CRISPR-associated protein Csy2 [Thalassolituus pacificus]|uniref:Type I-F CRISPR-associated protein Csy2 n=1 Tax=Thalassolituus pacificus TaxID=2975440 RepID=A0A9X3ARE2_9GAMM|nr:type I-F CRISPR-associated protein Csy2 [Thalassolituus pacificus]MCT7357678.1 type I-F CRISPR-associated protein Csy2 [Thalassolituus pacificus]